MKKLIYILIPILLFSCKSKAELAMERGIRLYDWNKLDEALTEFSTVRYLLSYDNNLSIESIELLAQAYFNLGITYAKMELYSQAEKEILEAISLLPNKEYRDVLRLVRAKMIPASTSSNK